MVTPIEEPQEEEIQEEVEIIATSSKSKVTPKFDFSVNDTDRSDLKVYTVSILISGDEPKTLTILAPHYGAALEVAGLGKGNTIKVSETPFEG